MHYELDSVYLILHEVLHRLRDDSLATRSHVAVTPLFMTSVSNCDKGCGVAVTGLRAQAILLTESEAIVHEHAVTSGIDQVAIHKLLLAQR